MLTSLINLKATTISPRGIAWLCRLVIQKFQETETYKMSEHTISAIDVAWALNSIFFFQSFFAPWLLQLLCVHQPMLLEKLTGKFTTPASTKLKDQIIQKQYNKTLYTCCLNVICIRQQNYSAQCQ